MADREHLGPEHFHFGQAWRDFQREHPDYVEVSDALLDIAAKHAQASKAEGEVDEDQLASGTMQQGFAPRASCDVVEDDEDDLLAPDVRRMAMAFTVHKGAVVGSGAEACLLAWESEEALKLVQEAWEHYDDHGCLIGIEILCAFLERLFSAL